LEQCHAVATAVDEQLIEHLGGEGEVLVHLDPCTPHHCPLCRVSDCPVRMTRFRTAPVWTLESATGNPLYRYYPRSDKTWLPERKETP
jgi:hypothetical protein